MNWLTFAIFAFAAYVLETSLRSLFAIGDSGVSPNLLLILMTFVGLMAPATTVLWASIVCGLLVDLQGGATLEPVLGPAALGFLLAGYAVLQLRGLVFRESAATLVVMTFVAGVFAQLAIVMIYGLRNAAITPAEPIPGWDAATQLYHRFFVLLYSAAAAAPVGWVLFRFAGAFGLHHHKARNDRLF